MTSPREKGNVPFSANVLTKTMYSEHEQSEGEIATQIGLSTCITATQGTSFPVWKVYEYPDSEAF